MNIFVSIRCTLVLLRGLFDYFSTFCIRELEIIYHAIHLLQSIEKNRRQKFHYETMSPKNNIPTRKKNQEKNPLKATQTSHSFEQKPRDNYWFSHPFTALKKYKSQGDPTNHIHSNWNKEHLRHNGSLFTVDAEEKSLVNQWLEILYPNLTIYL